MLEDHAIVGNCQFGALVRTDGAVAWCCLPRFDSEPVFGELIDPDGGVFVIGAADGSVGKQRYLDNTNVLETRFEGSDGAFRILDFAPRFHLHGRMFRPTKLIRIVEPLTGTPRVRVRCEPRLGWSKRAPRVEHGSNHLSFLGYTEQLRLTTDVPISYLDVGQTFALTARKHFVLAWGAPVEEALAPLCERFLRETERYWRTWVKHCEIPASFQQEVIRSALALKLHCFEDTGAIVASITTSLPESPGSGRTWDYRYCWLRDAYYTLDAFRLLGHFEEREGFVDFLLNVASSSPDLALAPLYRIDGRLDLDERIEKSWAGFRGEGPVRVGNGAMHHRQNDVFGEMVLALAPTFLDARFASDRTRPAHDLLVRLARKALSVAGQPDASIWEFRTEWTPQTFSSVMCWAGADRVSRIVATQSPAIAQELAAGAEALRQQLLTSAWNESLGAFTASSGGKDLDASLLQMAVLRFLPATDPRLCSTVHSIRRSLEHDGWLRRYDADDGFGKPTVAFAICTYWLVEALATIGEIDEARSLFERVRQVGSPVGLLSEDIDPLTGALWGNYPQAYSHVGFIHAAFAAAPRWSEVV